MNNNNSDYSITSELLKEESKLKGVIRKWVAEQHDQADVYQETLTTVIEQHQQSPIKNPIAYAITVARHFAWKLGNRSFEVYDESSDLRESHSAEDSLLQNEQIEKIQQVLNAMPPMRQQVFIRRRLHNQSREQIAQDLDLTEEAVKKHISRALAQIAMHVD